MRDNYENEPESKTAALAFWIKPGEQGSMTPDVRHLECVCPPSTMTGQKINERLPIDFDLTTKRRL